MTPQQAIAIINTMKFRPGWKFHAELPPWWYYATIGSDSQVFVAAEVTTFDTSYRAADGTLTRPMTQAPGSVIDVGPLDQAGLMHAILTQIVRPFDDHEDREFMRIQRPDGTWYAPLHPHHDAGKAAWARLADERLTRCLVNAAGS